MDENIEAIRLILDILRRGRIARLMLPNHSTPHYVVGRGETGYEVLQPARVATSGRGTSYARITVTARSLQAYFLPALVAEADAAEEQLVRRDVLLQAPSRR